MNATITLHALGTNRPQPVNAAHIIEIVETRFGGCSISFSDKNLPAHFWESRDEVLRLMKPTS